MLVIRVWHHSMLDLMVAQDIVVTLEMERHGQNWIYNSPPYLYFCFLLF